ncbi:hypothetical protein CR513_55801, partial [Mucuna pruriens]
MKTPKDSYDIINVLVLEELKHLKLVKIMTSKIKNKSFLRIKDLIEVKLDLPAKKNKSLVAYEVLNLHLMNVVTTYFYDYLIIASKNYRCLKKEIEIKNLGRIKFYLGLQIEYLKMKFLEIKKLI